MFSRLLRRRALPVDEMVDGEVALDPGSHNGTASLQGPDPDDDLMIEEVQASDEAGFSGVIELPGDEVELSEVVELPDEVELPGDEGELPLIEQLLLNPPDGCHDTAAMWEQSRQAALQTSISARELFAYWIYRSNLHEVERRRLDEIYAQFDSGTLKTLSQAVREFRENPVAVEDYVDSLRNAELETSDP